MADKAKKKIYEKVAEYIKAAIYNGEMKLGDAIYSENHLCEVLQVSRTSVRKAIRQMVEENILISRPGVGTFVKSVGHGVIHNSICLFNHYTRNLRLNIADRYYSDMIYSAERAATEAGTNFQIFSGPIVYEEDIADKTNFIKTDGIIVDGNYQSFFSDLDFISKVSPNLVIMDGQPNETLFPVVAPDLLEPYKELIDMALEYGKSAILLYSDYLANGRWRKDCFIKAMKQKRKLNVEFIDYSKNIPMHLYNKIDHQYLIQLALSERLSKDLPGCIICISDHTALLTLKFLEASNLRVPEDIGLAGTGGLAFTEMVNPGITTISINPENIAKIAVERLLKMINGETWDNGILSCCSLIRRESL